MNVFEDLIEELKDENLIEDSVFDLIGFDGGGPNGSKSNGRTSAAADYLLESSDGDTDETAGETDAIVPENEQDESVPPSFQKHAMDEIASLQMVDHIFSGVEREQTKSSSEAFDDLDVKKALHRFLQITESPESQEFREAHLALLSESEAWFSALVLRDEKISVANLRRFCETSRPVLSSQALISLARFYRNAPFNEMIRGKFDYLLTRLFSRELGDEKRRMICVRMDIPGHINTLYSRWASLNVYDSEEYADLIREHVTGISVFAAEAEAADSLESLISNGFFQRVRQAKEQLSDLFFAPEVAAAVIDCNLRVGNRFVDLVNEERVMRGAISIDLDRSVDIDGLVSEASGKTFHLAELLDIDVTTPEAVAKAPVPSTQPAAGKYAVPDFERAERSETRAFLKVNKWLLVLTLLFVFASVGVYLWAESYENSATIKAVAPEFNLKGSEIEPYLTTAKRTTETMYGVTSNEWRTISDDRKKELMKGALQFASTSGIRKIQLVDVNGRAVGFASADRVEITEGK